MDFEKVKLTRTRILTSLTLMSQVQSYNWWYYYKTDQYPAKVSLIRELGKEKLSIGFIKIDELHQFVLDSALAYCYMLDKRAKPDIEREQWIKYISRIISSDVERYINNKMY